MNNSVEKSTITPIKYGLLESILLELSSKDNYSIEDMESLYEEFGMDLPEWSELEEGIKDEVTATRVARRLKRHLSSELEEIRDSEGYLNWLSRRQDMLNRRLELELIQSDREHKKVKVEVAVTPGKGSLVPVKYELLVSCIL